MKDILTAIGAFFAFREVSKMLTLPLNRVPADWAVLRVVLVAFAVVGLLMFTSYGLHVFVKYWPF